MADYKILQNIDLAQNEIKEVSKIANDRQDGKDKGLLIQTGNNTSLAFNRKIKSSKTINSIKGTVKDGADGDKQESTLNLEPSKVVISNTKGTETSTNSTITIGLTTPDSEGKEHIEAVSPSIDINTGKTGDTDYTHPYISLKEEGSKLELQSETVEIRSEGDTKSSLTMDGGITGVSNSISLKDSSKKSSEKVSLTLNSDGTNGTIEEKASKSITAKTLDNEVSLTLEKNADSTHSITLENKKDTNTPKITSKIEVLDSKVKISKGSDSYVDIRYNNTDKQVELEEQSNKVTIKTLSDNVTLTLDGNTEDIAKSSASLTSKGTITLTSQGDAKTEYKDNAITTEADDIIIKAKGYDEADTKTNYYPHIELKSTKDTDPVNSILLEGKTINISSKDKDSNAKDNIKLSGTKLNVGSTTTEVTSKDIKVQHKETVLKDGESKEEDILVLEISNNSGSKLIRVPTTTEVDINSTKIGIGDTNSTTTISGSELKVETKTNIKGDSTLSGTTTLQSSKPTSEKPTPENTLKVDTESTSITGLKAEINPTTINIGTATNTEKSVVTTDITIGNNAGGTTKLTSEATSIISPKLSVSSGTVEFTGSNISINNTKDDKGKETSSVSLTSNVDTSVVDKTFSVKNGSTDILKADTTSVSLAGTSTTITSGSVGIGTDTTTSITIGRNASGTPTPITTLQSSTTNITSPTIKVGTDSPSTSVSIGKASSNVTLKGNHNLSIDTNDTTSKVQANDIKFNTSLSSNDIKIRWDSTLNSLVFEKV